MSATPGSAAYYEQQMQAAKQREEQRAAQNQANQQVNYEAYQAATKEAQDKAVQTGQPQTVTQQDIQTQRQQILDTKYYNPAESSPEQKVYSVPLTGVNKEAQQAGYDYYYKPVPGFNKPQAQLAQENYIPNRQARQEAIAQNAVAGYNGGLMRPNVHYQVNLEDSISGPSKHYFVGLYEGKRPQYYGPPSPFESPRTQEARIATSATNPNFSESLTAGYQNYFENLKETVSSNGGILRDPKYAPEVEGALIGSVLVAMKDQPRGIDMLGQIGRESIENPGYALGSIGASVGFTLGTIGIGKGVTAVRGAVGGIRAFSEASKIGEIAEVAARQVGVKDVTTQAFRVSKAGIEIPLERGRFGIYTEPVSKAGVKASKSTIPDYFRIESRAVDKEGVITGIDDVGYSSARTGKTSVYSGVLDKKEATKFLEPEAGKPAAESYTEVAQLESNVLKNIGTYTRIRGSEGVTTPIVKTTGGAKVSEPVSIGGLLNYDNKELAKFTGEFAKPKSGAAAAKSLGKFVGNNPYSGSAGSTSGRSGANTILGTVSKTDKDLMKNAALKDIGVFSAEKEGAKGSSIIPGIAGSAAKAIGGFSGYGSRESQSNTSGVSLGFGGATGAERKAAKKAIEELTQSFIPTPATSSKSSTNSISKLLGDLSNGSRSKTQNDSVTSEITKGLEHIVPKQGTSLNSLLGLDAAQQSKSVTRTETAAITGISSALLPALTTRQASQFKFDIPSISRTKNANFSVFNFNLPGFDNRKQSKKRKKKEYLYGEGAFARTDIVANSVSKQIANIIDSAIGKVE